MQKSRWAPKAEEAEAPQTTTEKSTPPETTANATSQPPPGPAPVQYTTAPTVSMSYEPAYDDPSIDPFAQTASTDDLFFDDDITPIAEPVVEQNPLELQVIDAEYLPEDIAPPTAPQAHLAPHIPQGQRNPERGGRGRGRGRGARRGRGGGGGGGGHVGDIRELEKKEKEQEKAAKEAEAASTPAPATTAPEPATTTEDNDASATPDAPTEPKEKPTHSVRGDRTLTGGPARTRLTEAQLSAKLASMRSKNEALQTAHARAEADLANFEAREAVLKKKDVERKKVLAEKQKAERQNRQQMMGEREKNRLRKLNAQGGEEEGGGEGRTWRDCGVETRGGAGVGGAGGRWGESELGGTRTGSWKGWERRQRWTW
ncbi:hypothetical protein HBI95_080040 [Parastagonospora nodorum]|nr:hypothetical protein HBI95_080040 [Parastagonospora nodorum]